MQFLPWVVVLLPFLGFVVNAFLGAKFTRSPRPVVDVSATTSAPLHNAGGSDAATFVPNPAVAAAGAESYDMEEADGNTETHHAARAYETPSSHDHPVDTHSGHGGHSEVHLDKGGKTLVGGIATAAVAASFAASLMLFFHVMGPEKRVFASAFEWMATPGFSLSFRLMVDQLTALMLLIITGVGTLIHLYSMGYMDHDKGYARYFSYLNLFVFFMLLLVMGANIPVLFVGWEGVGLASYLLIGFYYERKSATDAGKKAFIVNRIGDAALLVAAFLIFQAFGTLDFYSSSSSQTPGFLNQLAAGGDNAAAYVTTAVTLVPLLMFLGAAGKSAQIPLYVWLPDAMEGPTPVSALIHAATMVTGGVYLLARCHPLFVASPKAMTVVAVIGLSTAFLAATIALVQNDIKRVLAYSTVSQLGYMFLACGVGAFGIAMFHVATHAFFKALLFLGAGSVIHAMGGEQDMRKMGGLAGKIKTTHLTMWIGTLAIAGFPLTAGFWSKDEILLNAYAGSEAGGLGSVWLWLGGFIVSAMTAFYMVRMMMKTFAGQPRYSEETARHIHESPATMTVPLLVLAVLSAFGGLALYAPVFGNHWLEHFLGTTVNWREAASQPLNEKALPVMGLLGASAVLAVVVILATRMAYANKANGDLRPADAKQRDPLWRTLSNKWYVDEVYDAAIVGPGRRLANGLWRFVDARVVDGAVNGTARSVAGLSNAFRNWQSGYVRNYALSMLVGVVLVIAGCLLGMRGVIGR